jgi:hypothetical protein
VQVVVGHTLAVVLIGRLAIVIAFLALVLVMLRNEAASEVEENRARRWVGIGPVGPVSRWIGRAILLAVAAGAVWYVVFPP